LKVLQIRRMIDITEKVKSIVFSTTAHSLGQGLDEQHRKREAYEFCLRVAVGCRAQGLDVGLLYKPTGNNINERSIDIICIRRKDKTVDHYDIVVGAEDPSARPTFDLAHGYFNGVLGKVDPNRFRVY
jgi:hypothetical protein